MVKYTNEQIKARLIFIVGVCLALSFVGSCFTLLYGLLFVTQPLEQAPNDAAAWELLNPMILFLTGGLSGLLAGNGLKDKAKDKDHESN